MHFNPISALLAIAWLAEVYWGATGVEWVPFEWEQTKCIFTAPVPWRTRKRANETEVSEGGHGEIRPLYREELTDRGMSRPFAERA